MLEWVRECNFQGHFRASTHGRPHRKVISQFVSVEARPTRSPVKKSKKPIYLSHDIIEKLHNWNSALIIALVNFEKSSRSEKGIALFAGFFGHELEIGEIDHQLIIDGLSSAMFFWSFGIKIEIFEMKQRNSWISFRNKNSKIVVLITLFQNKDLNMDEFETRNRKKTKNCFRNSVSLFMFLVSKSNIKITTSLFRNSRSF